MRIISDEVNKGIYLHECDKDSIEEFIWKKINKLPIAQNILITNKETPSEEIRLFFIELYYVIIIYCF